MSSKTMECSISMVWTTALKVLGVIAGIMLIICGICAISADSDLFRRPVWRYYTGTTLVSTFRDTGGFTTLHTWRRIQDKVRWRWETTHPRRIIETTIAQVPIEEGFGMAAADATRTGDFTITLKNFTLTRHYYCISHSVNPYVCDDATGSYGWIHVHDSTQFQYLGYYGNQNYRFSYIVLAISMILFGLVIILGELGLQVVTSKFTFYYYPFVKGLIYIATGVLVLAMANIVGLFTALILWATGLLNCWVGRDAFLHFHWNEVGRRGTTTIVTRREYI